MYLLMCDSDELYGYYVAERPKAFVVEDKVGDKIIVKKFYATNNPVEFKLFKTALGAKLFVVYVLGGVLGSVRVVRFDKSRFFELFQSYIIEKEKSNKNFIDDKLLQEFATDVKKHLKERRFSTYCEGDTYSKSVVKWSDIVPVLGNCLNEYKETKKF